MVAPSQLDLATDVESKLVRYRSAIAQSLTRHIHSSPHESIQTYPIFDPVHDHYQLLDMGWDERGKRVFLPIIHLDLIEGKVWVQENHTDVDIAQELIEAGVEPSDIVLGFYAPITDH
jgi:hypothetical protein